jgi:uncharacterized protein (DUF433 family)
MALNLIESNPAKLNGQPCVVGTRLTVRRVLALLAEYPQREELFREFPELNEQAVQQVLKYAQAQLPDLVSELAETP